MTMVNYSPLSVVVPSEGEKIDRTYTGRASALGIHPYAIDPYVSKAFISFLQSHRGVEHVYRSPQDVPMTARIDSYMPLYVSEFGGPGPDSAWHPNAIAGLRTVANKATHYADSIAGVSGLPVVPGTRVVDITRPADIVRAIKPQWKWVVLFWDIGDGAYGMKYVSPRTSWQDIETYVRKGAESGAKHVIVIPRVKPLEVPSIGMAKVGTSSFLFEPGFNVFLRGWSAWKGTAGIGMPNVRVLQNPKYRQKLRDLGMIAQQRIDKAVQGAAYPYAGLDMMYYLDPWRGVLRPHLVTTEVNGRRTLTAYAGEGMYAHYVNMGMLFELFMEELSRGAKIRGVYRGLIAVDQIRVDRATGFQPVYDLLTQQGLPYFNGENAGFYYMRQGALDSNGHFRIGIAFTGSSKVSPEDALQQTRKMYIKAVKLLGRYQGEVDRIM